MSRYLFYSDLHIRPERLADCEAVLDRVYLIACRLRDKYGPITIVNGGDTFNTRGIIRTVCFDRLYKHYQKWFNNSFNQIILVGNHDQEDRAGEIHPMSVFKSWEGWHVVDIPKVINDVAFFPHMEIKSREDIYKHIKADFKGDAVVHWGIRGARRNDHNVDRDGIPIEWLDRFRQVFSGHYHFRNSIANLQYIGSPMQQNHGEEGQAKGVLFYNSKTTKCSFIEIAALPKHYTVEVSKTLLGVTYEPKGIFKLEDIRATDFVRFQVSGDAELCNQVTRASLEKEFKTTNVKIERFVKEKHYSRLNLEKGEVFSASALANKYVDFVDTSLDKKKLIGIGQELLK